MTILRSLLFNAVYFAVSLAVSVYGALICRTQPQALALGKLWARLLVGAAQRICGIRLHVTGQEHLPPNGPALIASQHQSAFDTMVWLTLLPRTAYVQKHELTRIPLFGPLTVLAGNISVDRAGGATAVRELIRATRRAQGADRQMVIFPEGTRAASGTVTPLHPGVAAMASCTGLPVIPVRTDSGRLWPRRSFRKYPGILHMQILPPIPSGLPRAALMRRLQAALTGVDDPSA